MITKYILNFWERYKKMSVVAKAAMWFTFSTVLQKGISFITVPIFTRLMTTEQYGLFSVYLSWVSVLTILGTMNFETCIYINSLAKFDNEKDKNDIAVSLIDLAFVITIIWFLIYLLAKPFWNNVLGMSTTMVVLMFTEIVFLPAVNLWTTKQKFEYKYKRMVLLTISQVVLNACFGILFVALAQEQNQAQARVLSITIVQAVIGSICAIYFFLRAKKLFVTKWWKKALQIHLPLLPHNLSLTVLASADRIMINSMVGASSAAFYSLAYSATMVMNLLKLSLAQALTPWVYKSIKAGRFEALKKRSSQMILLITAFVFVFILFAPEVVYIVGSSEYREAVYCIPPVAASIYFTFLYNLFSNIEFYYERTKEIMYASIGAAVLNIVLNIGFIKAFGYTGAAYTTLICYMVLSLVHYCVMKDCIKKNIGEVELFDKKLLIYLSVIVLICTGIFTISYRITVLRYSLIVAMLIVGFVKKKQIVGLLQEIKKG